MSLGEVDTLNLMVEKLENLFNESQDYYETFLDTNNLFKEGKLTEKEFFQKLGDYVVCLLYTSPSPRDATLSRMQSYA